MGITQELVEELRENIRVISREKFKEINSKYPQFCDIYNAYIDSANFKRLIKSLKRKYDETYQKLFLRHALNFLNIYLKENDNPEANFE
jgi:hypothetical protein